MADDNQTELTKLTVELLSAYLANNSIASDDLPALIATTRASLSGAASEPVAAAEEFVPAVGIRKSLSSKDVIISLIDGKPYKTLKRHLASNGLTPDEYRARYNLPSSYPLVAPSYSERRREVAAASGLGRAKSSPATTATPATAAPKTEPVKAKVESVAAKAPKAAPAKAEPKSDAAPKAKVARAKPTAAPKAPKADAAKSATVKADATTQLTPASVADKGAAATKPRRKLKIVVGDEAKSSGKAEPKAKVAKDKIAAAPKAPRAKKAADPVVEPTAPATAPAKWDDKISV
jgi:predicted transcriptional regulator